MPDAIITSTASTFGTISGTFAADQSTVTGTVTGTITGTLSGSVGVPGPAGPAGPAGPQGAPGQGVAAGGSTGQVLQKLSSTSYDTGWATLPADYINSVSAPLAVASGVLSVDLSTYLPLAGGYMTGAIFNTNGIGGLYLNNFSLGADRYTTVSWSQISLCGGSGSTAKTMTIQGDGITFWHGGISKQTVAYPGAEILFDNAALTGNPSAPTPATSDNSTSIATTAFVKAQGYLTSAPVTSVAGKTGVVTLDNTDISGLGSLAVVNDAPSNGSQYARKNAAWDVVISGDRYLTTSTTSNTVSNGNKTFTIGTGLSYTPTQNITISYDASNHMHGEVLTYNSGTGVMTVDVNHHTGSGTYASWVVNVGGVTPATSVAWGAITGTLSTQTDLQAALDLKANSADSALTGNVTITSNSTGAALFIQQAGTGNILTLHDQASDTTFVAIDQNGKVNTIPSVTASAGFNIPHGVTPSAPINGDVWSTTAGLFARISNATQQYQTVSGMTSYMTKGANLSDVNSVASARNNLQLGTAQTAAFRAVNLSEGAAEISDTLSTLNVITSSGGYGVGGSTASYVDDGFGAAIVSESGSFGLDKNNFSLALYPTYDTSNPSSPTSGIELNYVTATGVLSLRAYDNPGSTDYVTTLSPFGLILPASGGSITFGDATVQTTAAFNPDLSPYAPLASPTFTGTPTLPTGTIATTQSPGNNTTALATTAFVTAAVPAFATSTQSRAASSTTVAQSPGSDMWQMMNPGFIRVNRAGHTYTATGTMGTFTSGWYSSLMNVGAGIASAKFRSFGTSQVDQSNLCISKGYRSYIDFSRRIWCSGRFYTENAAWSDPNVSARFYFGKAENSANGDPARKSFGWSLPGNATAANRNPVLQVHNGTTLTNVATTFAVVGQQYFDWDIVADGAGNVTLYINGTQYATTALGPTGDTSYSGSAPVLWQEELVATAVPTLGTVAFSRGLIYIAP